jgi:hypothetical protein
MRPQLSAAAADLRNRCPIRDSDQRQMADHQRGNMPSFMAILFIQQ